MNVDVGDYAVKRSMLVRIAEEISPGRFSVEYVSYYEHGAGVCCGGGSFAWTADDFTPVTDAKDFVLCAAYEAKRRIAEAKKEIEEQQKVFAANIAALEALSKAQKAARPISTEDAV